MNDHRNHHREGHDTAIAADRRHSNAGSGGPRGHDASVEDAAHDGHGGGPCVAMYIGNGQIVHASTASKPVYVSSVYYGGPNAVAHRVVS